MKKCSTCKIEKSFDNFYKDKNQKDFHTHICKECRRKYSKSDKNKLVRKSYYLNNKIISINRVKEYYHKNKESISLRNYNYYNQNKELINNRRKKYIYKKDLNWKLRNRLRSRINKVIKGEAKGGSSAVKDLGCSIEEFKIYIESKFQLGMNWDNWSRHGWHIDHIKPLSKFNLKDREQFLLACHYTNLQPLWAIDNLRKSKK